MWGEEKCGERRRKKTVEDEKEKVGEEEGVGKGEEGEVKENQADEDADNWMKRTITEKNEENKRASNHETAAFSDFYFGMNMGHLTRRRK